MANAATRPTTLPVLADPARRIVGRLSQRDSNWMKICFHSLLVLILWSQQDIGTAQEQTPSPDSVPASKRLNYHTAPDWTNPLMVEQHRYAKRTSSSRISYCCRRIRALVRFRR